MKRVKEIFGSNTKVYDIKKKGKCLICTLDDRKYAIKKCENTDVDSIYEYLSSRNFEFYPKLVAKKDNYNVYEYIEEIENPYEQKAYDMINLLSLLHNKTTYYKDMDIDEYKETYESINYIIDSRMNYYNSIINKIESSFFSSPSEYLIARNISKIFGSLEYSKRNINEWYDLVKTKGKKRMVTLYNNIDLDHVIRNKEVYLIGFEKTKIDIPIYDLYNFYIKYGSMFDFRNLLKHYEDRYPLLEEEKKLFNILISIPNEIELGSTEIDNCKNTKKIIDYIYRSEVLVRED